MSPELASANKPVITVEDAGPCRKKISIEIPAVMVAEKLDDSLRELSVSAALPGFRPGKAPRKLIERRFGADLRNDTRDRMASEAYSDALREHQLRVIGEPEGGEELRDTTIDAGTPLAFSVEVEVAPEFELPSFADVEIMRPVVEITDEMVETQLDKFATNEGELKAKESAEPGDYLVGHGVMVRDSDEKEIHNIEGAVVQIPEGDAKGMILGVLVEDFAAQVGSPKKGDTLTIATTGPANHEVVEVRGERLTVTFAVEEVNEVIPATREALIERYNMQEEGQLRAAIRQRIEHQLDVEQRQAMRAQVARVLTGSVDFELPERLTATQAARNLERRRMDLMYQGVEPQQIEEQMAELRASSDEVARRELKLFFILDKYANDNEIGVGEQEINGFIAQLALSRGLRPEAVRSELIQSGRVQAVARQIREHKALDSMVEHAKVVDTPIEEFRKAFEVGGAKGDGEGDGDSGGKPAATKKKTTKKSTKKTTKKTSKKD